MDREGVACHCQVFRVNLSKAFATGIVSVKGKQSVSIVMCVSNLSYATHLKNLSNITS